MKAPEDPWQTVTKVRRCLKGLPLECAYVAACLPLPDIRTIHHPKLVRTYPLGRLGSSSYCKIRNPNGIRGRRPNESIA